MLWMLRKGVSNEEDLQPALVPTWVPVVQQHPAREVLGLQGELMSVYRIRERIDGGEWNEGAGGRVYRTLSAARGNVTRMKDRYSWWGKNSTHTREWKIQEAVTEWGDLPS